MKQLWINFLKWFAVFTAGCIFIAYIGYKIQVYLRVEIYDGETPNNIRLLVQLIAIVMILLLLKWTVYKPSRILQRARDERITRMGISAAKPENKD